MGSGRISRLVSGDVLRANFDATSRAVYFGDSSCDVSHPEACDRVNN